MRSTIEMRIDENDIPKLSEDDFNDLLSKYHVVITRDKVDVAVSIPFDIYERIMSIANLTSKDINLEEKLPEEIPFGNAIDQAIEDALSRQAHREHNAYHNFKDLGIGTVRIFSHHDLLDLPDRRESNFGRQVNFKGFVQYNIAQNLIDEGYAKIGNVFLTDDEVSGFIVLTEQGEHLMTKKLARELYSDIPQEYKFGPDGA